MNTGRYCTGNLSVYEYNTVLVLQYRYSIYSIVPVQYAHTHSIDTHIKIKYKVQAVLVVQL